MTAEECEKKIEKLTKVSYGAACFFTPCMLMSYQVLFLATWFCQSLT